MPPTLGDVDALVDAALAASKALASSAPLQAEIDRLNALCASSARGLRCAILLSLAGGTEPHFLQALLQCRR